MFVKLLHWLGILAAVLLMISCVLPWTFHADVHESFTGFYSHANIYGKPGKLLCILGGTAFILMWLPKIWAKRTNLFVCALAVGYAIKSYILYTSCYNAYCPQKLPGIFIMLFATIVMQIAAILPDVQLPTDKNNSQSQ